jgi:hypothetical protein
VLGKRHIEIFGYLPDGTKVPKVDSSDDHTSRHTRTIGSKSGVRENLRVPFSAAGGVNMKQESPGKGSIL